MWTQSVSSKISLTMPIRQIYVVLILPSSMCWSCAHFLLVFRRCLLSDASFLFGSSLPACMQTLLDRHVF